MDTAYPTRSAAAAARASALRKAAKQLPQPASYDRQGHRMRRERAAMMERQADWWDREASRLLDAGL